MFDVKPALLLFLCSLTPLLLLFSCDSTNDPSGPGGPVDTSPDTTIPINPYPADFATDVLYDVELRWEIEGTAGYYAFDVYFGVEENPPLIAEEIAGTIYPIEGLDFGQTYYWKIVTRDIYGQETEGPVWRFSTFNGIYIDEGFEENFPPDGWMAGWGWERSNSANSGNYSAMGYVSFYDRYDKSGYVYIDFYAPWFNNDPTVDRTLDLSFFYRLDVDYNGRGYAGFQVLAEIETGGETEETVYGYMSEQSGWTDFGRRLSTEDLGERFRLIFRCYAGGGAGGWGWARGYFDDILLVDSEVEI